MHFTLVFLSLFAFLFSVSSPALVLAAPLTPRAKLVAFRPTITAPAAGVRWPVYSHQVVSWNTSDVPPEAANTTGTIYLGRLHDGSENLDVGHPLAEGFPIMSGEVYIVVPKKPSFDDYIVALVGDSGNASPMFRITADES